MGAQVSMLSIDSSQELAPHCRGGWGDSGCYGNLAAKGRPHKRVETVVAVRLQLRVYYTAVPVEGAPTINKALVTFADVFT